MKVAPLSNGHVTLKNDFNGPGECIHKGSYGSGYMSLYITSCAAVGDEEPSFHVRIQIGEPVKTFMVRVQPTNNTSISPCLKNVYVDSYEEVWAAIETHRNEFIVHGFVSSEPIA